MYKPTKTVKNVSKEEECLHCDDRGYIEILNAYDPDFKIEERCVMCELGEAYSQSN